MSEAAAPIEVRAYGATGDPPVLVLHGGPGAPGSVAALARALAARGFRALEPLQRGARPGVNLTVARHVADLAAVAPDTAPVVGWSWGAMLGLSYAAAFPARVTRLALVGCGTYALADREEYKRRVAARTGAELAALKAAVAAARDPLERGARLAAVGAYLDAAQAVDPLPPAAEPDPRAVDEAANRETWDDALRLQAEGVEPARFAAVTCSARMFHGACDPHPGRETCATLRAHLPQLDYVEYPRCGHTPWAERGARDAFLADLAGWLRSGGPSATRG